MICPSNFALGRDITKRTRTKHSNILDMKSLIISPLLIAINIGNFYATKTDNITCYDIQTYKYTGNCFLQNEMQNVHNPCNPLLICGKIVIYKSAIFAYVVLLTPLKTCGNIFCLTVKTNAAKLLFHPQFIPQYFKMF